MSVPYEGDSTSATVPGLSGKNTVGVGVLGTSQTTDAVQGTSTGQNSAGVAGRNDNPAGNGVLGITVNGTGVNGSSSKGNGVNGIGALNGVFGTTTSTAQVFVNAGVSGLSNGSGSGVLGQSNGNGPGILAIAKGRTADVLALLNSPGLGAFVAGNLMVSGDILLIGADFAEDFDIVDSEKIEPGTVMVINQRGALETSQSSYDKRVAGVISGAGKFRPGIILDKQAESSSRLPVALLGKVCCKVDAQYGPIEVGDMLTTSQTPGHAMKACDPIKAFGAVIGKALKKIETGQGLIPILIALQ